MFKITIPQPCHENWNVMTPNEQGRFCNACAKTVVDFTQMSDDEVKHFLLAKKEEERICGRFKNGQLQDITISLPQNIFELQMPWWKKFLVASLVAFSSTLFSCNTTLTGEPKTTIKISLPSVIEGNMIQPVKDSSPLVGIVSVPPADTSAPVKCSIVKGDVALLPIDTLLDTLQKKHLKGEIAPVKNASKNNITVGKIKVHP